MAKGKAKRNIEKNLYIVKMFGTTIFLALIKKDEYLKQIFLKVDKNGCCESMFRYDS